jgi:hypothetical protein
MDETERVHETVRAVGEMDGHAAAMYHALSPEARKGVLGALDRPGLESLTRLIRQAKKRRFTAAHDRFLDIAAGDIATPVYLLDETLIEENMRVTAYVKDRTGCKVLHALKSYASFATFPVMSRYLDGTSASGLNEARLGREEFGGRCIPSRRLTGTAR